MNQVTQGAVVAAQTGANPFMLATIVMVCLLVLGALVWLIRSGEQRSRDVVEDYQSRVTKQQDDFRVELKEQRAAHETAIIRQGEVYERSLEKIVASNDANNTKIVGQLNQIEVRLGHVERVMVPPTVTVNAGVSQ